MVATKPKHTKARRHKHQTISKLSRLTGVTIRVAVAGHSLTTTEPTIHRLPYGKCEIRMNTFGLLLDCRQTVQYLQTRERIMFESRTHSGKMKDQLRHAEASVGVLHLTDLTNAKRPLSQCSMRKDRETTRTRRGPSIPESGRIPSQPLQSFIQRDAHGSATLPRSGEYSPLPRAGSRPRHSYLNSTHQKP